MTQNRSRQFAVEARAVICIEDWGRPEAADAPNEPCAGRSKLDSQKLAGQVGWKVMFSGPQGLIRAKSRKTGNMGGHSGCLLPKSPAEIHRD